jgi:tetratricopeptide (TPR) repeat protein
VKSVPLIALLLAVTASAEDASFTKLIVQGDEVEKQGKSRVALEIFRRAEKLKPNDVGVLLRIAKQYSDLVSQTHPKEAAQKVAEQSLEYSQRAVALDDSSAKAHLSLAIAYGRMTDFVGNKEKLEYSKLIKQEAERAAELDPKDDFSWHVLGRWHAGVADTNGVLKAMAKVVYGGLPPASMEDAAKYLKKAVEIAPQRMIHRAELARVYEKLHKTELARQEWQNVLGIKPVDSQDQEYHREAKVALQKSKPAREKDKRVAQRRSSGEAH